MFSCFSIRLQKHLEKVSKNGKKRNALNKVFFGQNNSFRNQKNLSKKFGPKFSLQVTPSYIHRNLVEKRVDQNNIFAIGSGARFKISNRVSLNAEYYYLLPGQTANDYQNSFSIGFDIETGGHVFQLHLTNSQSIIERGFITETSGRWMDGDIRFGFNITRVFGLQRKSKK